MHPETEATNLLQELGINKLPINPVKIIKKLNIQIAEHNFNSIEGCFIFDSSGKSTFIGVNSNIKEQSRKNFTYAHELGHYCLHALNEILTGCQKNDINNVSKGLHKTEVDANIFASYLLLPEFLIKNKIQNINQVDPSWKSLSKWANYTETSLITMACRFIELTDHICLLAVIDHNKVIKYFKKSRNWALYLDMASRFISPQSYAYKAFSSKSIPNNFEYVPANYWISDRRLPFDTEILEWSLPLNSYGNVLTLLWDNEDILDKYESDEILYNNNDKIAGVWSPPTFHKSKRKS